MRPVPVTHVGQPALPTPLTAPIEVSLPEGWGEAWLDPLETPARVGAVRAYTVDGWRFSWLQPAGGRAGGCDAERDGTPPAVLMKRFGVPADSFWQAWVAAEACAKASGLPILAWLGRHGLRSAPGLQVHQATITTQQGPVFVALARAGQAD